MQISRVIEVLESIAPPEYAAEWDNVGLLIG
jgi:putative NIF3 family GTP cyclohydrolase 1 type 2